MSLVGSAVGIVRRNGDVYAIPHRVHASEIRYTKRPFEITTYGHHYTAPEIHGGSKKLQPYAPFAPRSRPHTVFPKPAPKNSSQIRFSAGGNHTDATRFVSTHRAMYTGQTGDLPVGYGNQGIAAERTRWMHSRQGK